MVDLCVRKMAHDTGKKRSLLINRIITCDILSTLNFLFDQTNSKFYIIVDHLNLMKILHIYICRYVNMYK